MVMRSMRSFRHDKDVPFYAYHLETMSPFMLITRPPHDKQTMSPFMLITSGNNVPFYAYQHLISRFMPIRVWKKRYIAFTQNRVFFWIGLSGLSFHSRQNTQCDLLGLPVLFLVPSQQGTWPTSPYLATGGKNWEWQKLGLHAIYYVSC